jgi:RNA polymerase sigma factor (sigma-70 family)
MVRSDTGQAGALAMVTDEAPHEQGLLQRVAQRDVAAFWSVWERYRTPLFSQYCHRWMGGNRADAADALSSACLKAWQQLPNHGRAIQNVQGWLVRLLYNHCRDLHRQHARYCDVFQRDDTGSTTEGIVQESAEAVVLQHEMALYLQRAFDLLPSRLREPALLRFYHGLPHRDIAAQLHLTPETVRKRVQQARGMLRASLQAYLTGTEGSADTPQRFDRY